MTKAERRKRARQRAKERERAQTTAEVTSAASAPGSVDGGVAELSVAAAFAEPEPAVHQAVVPTESEFITGPVVPRVPGPARTARPELAGATRRTELELSRQAAAAPVDNGQDDTEQDGSDQDEEEDEDVEEGEEGEDEELDEQDALFNLACASVEEGDGLTWNELVTWMVAAEVDDPRLAVLTALLATDEDTTEVPKLTGARVLEVLEKIGLEELVAEARDTVAAAPKEDETEEERVLVRTSARELQAQAKRELGGDQPVKASQLRAAKAGGATR